MENRIRELERDLKVYTEDKQKYEIEYKIYFEKYSDIKKKYDELENECNYIKTKESEVIFY